MINATISTMAMGNWTTLVPVTSELLQNCYRLKRPMFIYVPYGTALGVGLLFVATGWAALVSNGVPAGPGFFQVLNTTTGHVGLEKAAARNCLGGYKDPDEELMGMRLVYGEVGGKEGRVRRAGFGAPEDVRKLDKGAMYEFDGDDYMAIAND